MTIKQEPPRAESRGQHETTSGKPSERVWAAIRLFLLAGVTLCAVGVAGRYLRWPLLASALGPTMYVFIAHPKSSTSRLRSAAVGHAVAVAISLGALAVFGLWSASSMSARGYPTLAQAGAAALALGLTLGALNLLHSHHAPAGATALLIATGLARPGKPLFGLLVGLAIIIVAGPAIAKLPLGRSSISETNQG